MPSLSVIGPPCAHVVDGEKSPTCGDSSSHPGHDDPAAIILDRRAAQWHRARYPVVEVCAAKVRYFHLVPLLSEFSDLTT